MSSSGLPNPNSTPSLSGSGRQTSVQSIDLDGFRTYGTWAIGASFFLSAPRLIPNERDDKLEVSGWRWWWSSDWLVCVNKGKTRSNTTHALQYLYSCDPIARSLSHYHLKRSGLISYVTTTFISMIRRITSNLLVIRGLNRITDSLNDFPSKLASFHFLLVTICTRTGLNLVTGCNSSKMQIQLEQIAAWLARYSERWTWSMARVSCRCSFGSGVT